MGRKPKVEARRVSKRIAEAKRVINPIVGLEATHKKKPIVAGAKGTGRKTKVTKMAHDRKKIVLSSKKIKAIKETSKNERGKRPFASEVTQTDISYKTLYINSQRKVENLTEENYKQAIDLSYRCGQVDAYEYIIGNMKNVVALSNVMRVTDAEMNLAEGTAPDAPPLNAGTEPEPSRTTKNS
ncbi:uncharacterized protein LOC132633264 [Lycium barbarum]|uniref:uncharacterized protein LOC132633264 n=1 Tax=Lycium barbarum TaxID=112863 RepID=UPI00293E1E9B|nr:uncharacterized protein LOC132633264 [Lycium barbarum]